MITSFRQDNKQKRKRRQLFVFGLLLASLFLILRTPLSGIFSSALHTLGTPLWVMEAKMSDWFRSSAELFRTKEALIAENARLRSTLDGIALEAYSREALREENDTLKERLGRKPENELLLARVLATPGRSSFDTLIIDAGDVDGVFVGMRVFTDGDFVIGEVSIVFHHSAVVTLYSTPGTELSVTVGTSSIPAISYGQGGGNFLVTLPKGVPVHAGDMVDIPALAPEYAGVVDAVERPKGSSLQNIYLKWPANMNDLKWVYLARPSVSSSGSK